MDWSELFRQRAHALGAAAADRRRQRAELCRAEARRVAGVLAGQPGVRRVILFGSLAGAGGAVHERSDVDLAVEGLSPERLSAVDAEIGTAAVPIDLLRLEDASPALRRRVEEEGEILHAAG